MREGEARFTDRETALILKRAAELEETLAPGGAGRGLTLAEIEGIAREVGIDPERVREAAAQIASAREPGGFAPLGPHPTRKVVRAVPRRLARGELAELIPVIEGHLQTPGTVTEALDSVQWTRKEGNATLQISLRPRDEETQIHVAERYEPRIRGMLHGLPAAWGGMIGFVIGMSLGLPGVLVAGMAGGWVLLGAGIGRAVWTRISRRSQKKVKQLAAVLAERAGRSRPSSRPAVEPKPRMSDA